MGPVLVFRGSHSGRWHLSGLVTTRAEDEPPLLSVGLDCVLPRSLARRCGQILWRYDFSLPLDVAARDREYRIGNKVWKVRVPAINLDLRLAFTACNGSERDDPWKNPAERNALWLNLSQEHARAPFHLLLQGGDQLYADPIWRKVTALAAWRQRPWRQRRDTPFSPEIAEAVANYYFESYRRLWSQSQLTPVLASIPSLMMWDDHDILDGWGSYAVDKEQCPMLQGIWSAAREHFALFQLGAQSDDLPDSFTATGGEHFGWAHRIGEIGLLAPDLRSERSRLKVMGEAGWRSFMGALERMAGCRHVLLVSTVPLVNAHLTTLERLFALIPGHQSWQDDLIDQWVSLAHWEEWSRLLDALLSFSARTGAQVTSLSGEIHLGALGVIKGKEAEIYQLTSSGIVHPPPSLALTRALEWASAGELRVAAEIDAEVLPFPGSSRRYFRARNWLELNLAATADLSATWHCEGANSIEQPSNLLIRVRRNLGTASRVETASALPS